MNQQYGVLRVVRVLASAHTIASNTDTQGRSTAESWLPAEGLVHVLTRTETTIGRALNNDVILLDLTVSREHAHLVLNEAGWHITNLTGQNVVRVNGRPVPGGGSLPVRPQDILVLGSTMLQLVAPQHQPLRLPEDEPTRLLADSPAHLTGVDAQVLARRDQDGQQTTLALAKSPTLPPATNTQSLDSQERYLTPLPPLDEQFWKNEEPENILDSSITMQFALSQRMGVRTRWLIVGIAITILVISAMVTIILNSVIGLSSLEQNGVMSVVTALTIPLIPAVGIFLLVNFMDRYEREPWFLRLSAFLWGAIIAIPPALFIETQIDTLLSGWLASNASNLLIQAIYKGLNAGITEETIKGLGLLLLFIILRDEFDNVTDGIVYGALIGAGFAMVENFGYFASNGQNFLLFLIVGRIILGWLGHSTFIACFGATLGYIRHTRIRWKQIVIPLIGYLLAVGLHSFFDFVDFQSSSLIRTAADNTVIMYANIAIIGNYIPPFLAQMGLLYVLIKSLSHEAAVIREFLAIEVSNGIVTVEEYALLQNSFQRTRRERKVWRKEGWRQWRRVKALYQAEIGLAFRKWHVSMGDKPKLGYRQPEDAYRERIRKLRSQLQAASPAQ
jgi:RsiW-degrading membrane proteinase PrsW (M82 family)/pSer/pThr/pTyr-binding forkhead associated (FHA) protein